MKDLLVPVGRDWLFDARYPVWKCPDCGNLNRYLNSFLELCDCCEQDHTFNWYQYVVRDGLTKRLASTEEIEDD